MTTNLPNPRQLAILVTHQEGEEPVVGTDDCGCLTIGEIILVAEAFLEEAMKRAHEQLPFSIAEAKLSALKEATYYAFTELGHDSVTRVNPNVAVDVDFVDAKKRRAVDIRDGEAWMGEHHG